MYTLKRVSNGVELTNDCSSVWGTIRDAGVALIDARIDSDVQGLCDEWAVFDEHGVDVSVRAYYATEL